VINHQLQQKQEKENTALFEVFVNCCNEKSIQLLFDLPLTPRDEATLEVRILVKTAVEYL